MSFTESRKQDGCVGVSSHDKKLKNPKSNPGRSGATQVRRMVNTAGDSGQHPAGTVTPLTLTTTYTPGITAIPILQAFLKWHKTQGQDGNSGGLGTPALNPRALLPTT